jgi:hypothetical protein
MRATSSSSPRPRALDTSVAVALDTPYETMVPSAATMSQMPSASREGSATAGGSRAMRYWSTRLKSTWSTIASASGRPRRSAERASGPWRMRARLGSAEESGAGAASSAMGGDAPSTALRRAVRYPSAAYTPPPLPR